MAAADGVAPSAISAMASMPHDSLHSLERDALLRSSIDDFDIIRMIFADSDGAVFLARCTHKNNPLRDDRLYEIKAIASHGRLTRSGTPSSFALEFALYARLNDERRALQAAGMHDGLVDFFHMFVDRVPARMLACFSDDDTRNNMFPIGAGMLLLYLC